MADPFTLGAIGIGSSVLGAGTSAAGAATSAAANQSNYLYQAQVAKVNSQLAQQNASFALQAGENKAGVSGAQTRQQIGQTLAAQGASGLAVGSGSALAVRQSEDLVGKTNQATIRGNAAQQAYSYNVQGYSDTLQGQMDTTAASYASTAGSIGVASSILGGASSVSTKYLAGTQTGLWNT